jgi:prevent-host-death family protein
MKMVNVHAAKTQLSALLEEAASGKEIIIAKAGKPVARLMPLERKKFDRRPGRHKGLFKVHEDFDAPLPPDIAAAFGMEE